jgi:excisionase family DNA binding protein
MEAINHNNLPNAVSQLVIQLERIEKAVTEKQTIKDTSKKKYSLSEAAKYCGMADPTFRTYIYRRKVAGTKFGKAWLFLEYDLDKFISDHRRPTADELKSQAFEKLTSTKRGGSK